MVYIPLLNQGIQYIWNPMRETHFIKQNKDNWETFEEELKKKKKDPEKLNSLFVDITDDLSYSNSFYKNRSVKYYLNSISQRLFLDIYKNKKTSKFSFFAFWKEELPAIIYHSRREYLISLIIFVLSVVIGMFSTSNDPEFAYQILGNDYIEMTLENIDKGDPLAVYKQEGELDMSIQITLNNLYVAFRTFILGIFFSIGTIIALLYNGVMVGTFHWFFFERGIVGESVITIWQHGTLELSAIVIAGMAGIVMGKGWLFPGTYTRLQAFKYSAMRGLKIYLGVMPIIIMAGFIEGFITRHTELHDVIRIGVILISAFIILGYYVYLPFKMPKQVKAKYQFEGLNEEPDNFKFDRFAILDTGSIFHITFRVYRKILGKLLLPTAMIAFAYGIVLYFIAPYFDFDFNKLSSQVNQQNYQIPFLGAYGVFIVGIKNLVEAMKSLFDYANNPILFLFNWIAFSLLCWIVNTRLYQFFFKEKLTRNQSFKNLFNQSGLVFFFTALLFTGGGWASVFALVNFPLALLTVNINGFQKKHTLHGIGRSVLFATNNLGLFLGVYLSILIIACISFFIISSPFAISVIEFINWQLPLSKVETQQVFRVGIVITTLFGLQLIIGFLITGFGVFYHTLREIKTAEGLLKKIDGIGKNRKLNGLEQDTL